MDSSLMEICFKKLSARDKTTLYEERNRIEGLLELFEKESLENIANIFDTLSAAYIQLNSPTRHGDLSQDTGTYSTPNIKPSFLKATNAVKLNIVGCKGECRESIIFFRKFPLKIFKRVNGGQK